MDGWIGGWAIEQKNKIKRHRKKQANLDSLGKSTAMIPGSQNCQFLFVPKLILSAFCFETSAYLSRFCLRFFVYLDNFAGYHLIQVPDEIQNKDRKEDGK